MRDESFLRIHPILLAAGRSARMGYPKLLADFDGKTAIALAIEACLSSVLGRPIVVLGHEADRIRAELPQQGLWVVLNEHYDLGMTSSLKAGLAALPPEALAFIIFPADHPLVTGTDLRALAQAFVGRSTDAQKIFMPIYRGRRGHPVLVDTVLLDEFRNLPEEVAFRSIIYGDPSRIAFVEVGNRGVLLDMDMPQDYVDCRREFRRQRGYTTRAMRRTHVPPDAPPPAGPAA